VILAQQVGAERVATGHYARVEYDEHTRRFTLKKGRDLTKDQSYFCLKMRSNSPEPSLLERDQGRSARCKRSRPRYGREAREPGDMLRSGRRLREVCRRLCPQ
jgi:tRNA-specific 2-thiouridylase